jgi:hypothetical protein
MYKLFLAKTNIKYERILGKKILGRRGMGGRWSPPELYIAPPSGGTTREGGRPGSPGTEQEPPMQTSGGGASISFVLKLLLEHLHHLKEMG